MLRIKVFLLTSLLLLPLVMHAQGDLQVLSDTLVWKAETLTDVVADTSSANNSEFVTYGSAKISWSQTGGETTTVFDFTVIATEDHWTTEGYILFTTTRKSKTQTFRFEQVNNITKLTFSYTLPEGTRSFVFNIDTVSPFPDQP